MKSGSKKLTDTKSKNERLRSTKILPVKLEKTQKICVQQKDCYENSI